MSIPVYTRSPLGLIPAIETGNFVYGKTGFQNGSQQSIFSSKHLIKKSSPGRNSLSQSPLTFGDAGSIHNNDVYNISTPNIIDRLKDIPPMKLKWSDFAYCRDYGVYPNNRLIICRRFNNPVIDDLTFTGISDTTETSLEPISTLVSWFDDTQNVIELEFGEEWVDADVSFREVLNNAGNDIGLGKIKINLGDVAYGAFNITPMPGSTEILQRKILQSLGIIEKSNNGSDLSEVVPSGSPNLIKEARQRKLIPDGQPGSGVKGRINVKVKCAWEQKFISGVDQTFIYYDILRTVLSFGGSDSVFYLGKRSNLTNLNSFFAEYLKSENGPVFIIKKVINALKTEIDELRNQLFNKINEFKNGLNKDRSVEDDTASSENSEQESLIGSIQNRIGKLLDTFTDTLIKKYRVTILGIVSSLTGLPSTPWHVTVGNPLRPILSSGDMECTGVSLRLGQQLSYNDLPSNIECEFTLRSARNIGIDEIFEKLSNSGIRISEDAKSYWNTEGTNNTYRNIEDNQQVQGTFSTAQNVSSMEDDFTPESVNEEQTKIGNTDSADLTNQNGKYINPDANSSDIII